MKEEKESPEFWKNAEGRFIRVIYPTAREINLLMWAGAKPFLSEQEFKKQAKKRTRAKGRPI
jgi:hypothetical protein